MRHVSEAGDDGDACERVDIPGHVADQIFCQQRVEPHRPHRHHVAEGEHHGRDKYRDQHQHFDAALRGKISAREQKSERRAQRKGNDHHARRDEYGIEKRSPEVRVFEDECVRGQTDAVFRIEKRRIEKALPEDEP